MPSSTPRNIIDTIPYGFTNMLMLAEIHTNVNTTEATKQCESFIIATFYTFYVTKPMRAHSRH